MRILEKENRIYKLTDIELKKLLEWRQVTTAKMGRLEKIEQCGYPSEKAVNLPTFEPWNDQDNEELEDLEQREFFL